MTYIYDIILNFQKNYYQFFEWNTNDKIINMTKISIYRVSDKDLLNLKNNQVIINKDFINKIKEDNKRNKKIMCIVTNCKIAVALLFNNKGLLLKKSSLIFEEEEEVIDLAKKLKETKISYIENTKVKNPSNILRIEQEKKRKIIDYIKNCNNILTLKYLYYEYYEKESNNKKNIKEKLIKVLSQEWNYKLKNIYNIIDILIKVKTN